MEAQPSPNDERPVWTRDAVRRAFALALVVVVGVASATPAAVAAATPQDPTRTATVGSPSTLAGTTGETTTVNQSTAAVESTTANGTTAATPTISRVSFSGPAVVDYNGSFQRLLWADANHTATVSIDTPTTARDDRVVVCLEREKASDETTTQSNAVCQNATLSGNATTVALSSNGWPFNRTGKQPLTVTLRNDSAVLDRTEMTVVVVGKQADLDDDSLSNQREVKAGTNMTVSDTDGDSLSDGAEVKKHGTNPLETDTDEDGARDAREVSVGTDPTDPDTDGDGISDGEELDKGMNPLTVDSDEDGLADPNELRLGTDPTNADTDDDGLSDFQELVNGTDPTLADTDDDGLTDATELEVGTDPTALDSDGDFLADGFERRLGTNPSDPLSPFGFLLAFGVVALFGARYASPRIDEEAIRARLGWLDSNGDRNVDDAPAGDATPTASTTDAGSNASSTEPVHDVPRPDASPDETTPPVMTDQERVKQLLHEHGGRLQQTTVIEETDWSKSKVSRLLSKMEDDGQLRKISVGRENLIAYPEDESEDSASPRP
ncbi:helix-turn-helix transcriptional regulator [Halorubellus litoreus]|uniref:Helix-turn-helix domain-containing protein n=1 Tax=Halorubellus litoreus TaxID=755308 RepID=A0ABD5VJY5_9EURY